MTYDKFPDIFPDMFPDTFPDMFPYTQAGFFEAGLLAASCFFPPRRPAPQNSRRAKSFASIFFFPVRNSH